MFNKRITAALFAIAIASSLIVAGGFMSSAFAAKKAVTAQPTNTIMNSDPTDKPSFSKSHITNAGGSSGHVGDTNSLSPKELKGLSMCQSGAAKDGDLTLAEVNDCYGKLFDQKQPAQGTDKLSSIKGNDQSKGAQGDNQITSSSLHGSKIGTMGEGFPF